MNGHAKQYTNDRGLKATWSGLYLMYRPCWLDECYMYSACTRSRCHVTSYLSAYRDSFVAIRHPSHRSQFSKSPQPHGWRS